MPSGNGTSRLKNRRWRQNLHKGVFLTLLSATSQEGEELLEVIDGNGYINRIGRQIKRGLLTSLKEVFIMKKSVLMVGLVVLGCLVLSSLSLAQHSHGGMSMGTPMKMFTKDVLVEGVQVTFQIMENDEHQKMLREMKMKEDIEPGTTHNITVILKDAKTQKEIANAQITMKVVDPKGQDQIKPLKYEDAMKSYDAYFKLPDKGKYQVIMLFKVGEQKRTAGIYYEIK